MSLTVTIIDNDTGSVVVQEKEAITFFGAFGNNQDYVTHASIALGNTKLAVSTFNEVHKLLERARPAIEQALRGSV